MRVSALQLSCSSRHLGLSDSSEPSPCRDSGFMAAPRLKVPTTIMTNDAAAAQCTQIRIIYGRHRFPPFRRR